MHPSNILDKIAKCLIDVNPQFTLCYMLACDFVDIEVHAPAITIDPLYAKEENCFKIVLYPVPKIFLRRGTADKLARVQSELEEQNLSLLITDGYRPYSIQKKIWQIVPDPDYVADPAIGSKHNRGAAVDITILDLPMGTEIDDLTEKAHHNYPHLKGEEKKNRLFLKNLMEKHGFIALPTEWWHYEDSDWEQYPICDICLSQL